MKVYLSGGMENAIKEGSEWRREIRIWLKNNLGHEVFDPVIESKKVIEKYNAKDYRTWKNTKPKLFKDIIQKLINQDLNAIINHSDYLIRFYQLYIL